MKKGETIEQIEFAVKTACELGYNVKLLFVVGTPYETAKDVEDKVRLSQKYPLDDVHFYNIIPYPGTELFDWIKEKNYFLLKPEKYLNDISCCEITPVFETPELPANERVRLYKHLQKVRRKINRKAFVRKSKGFGILYTASLITTTPVIPAKAGIQKGTGFRVKPGMTNCIRLMSPCISRVFSYVFVSDYMVKQFYQNFFIRKIAEKLRYKKAVIVGGSSNGHAFL